MICQSDRVALVCERGSVICDFGIAANSGNLERRWWQLNSSPNLIKDDQKCFGCEVHYERETWLVTT